MFAETKLPAADVGPRDLPGFRKVTVAECAQRRLAEGTAVVSNG